MKDIATDQLPQLFSGKEQQQRGDDQAATADRSEAHQYPDHKPQQWHAPTRQVFLVRNTLALSGKVTLNVFTHHNAHSYRDQRTAQQMHNQVVNVSHTLRLFEEPED